MPASCQWRLAGRDGSVEGGKHRSLIPLNQVSLQRTGFKVNKCVCVFRKTMIALLNYVLPGRQLQS